MFLAPELRTGKKKIPRQRLREKKLMKTLILLTAMLLTTGAVAESRTPGPLSTKETGKLLLAKSHLDACEADLAEGEWTTSCDQVRRHASSAAALESRSRRWCALDRSRREKLAPEAGVHPSCERLVGGETLARRAAKIEQLKARALRR